MSLLDGAIGPPHVLERRAHTLVPLFRCSRIRRRCCIRRRCFYAKIKVDDDEQEHQVPHKGFSIRVPTIPKFGDIDSARRLLESAFQNLSFDMPKIPIDSALQSLPFGIPKLFMPIPVLVLDITGFVVTKLKKPQKTDLEDFHVDEGHYPRCAWPRTLKGAQVGEVANIGLLQNPHEQEVSHQIPVGPHCAWPRMASQLAEVSGSSSFGSVVQYAHSAWPRGSIPANGAALASKDLSKLPAASKEDDISPCVIEGGPRCAWPRKGISAKQSYYAKGSTDNAEKLEAEVWSGGKAPPAECGEAAELPRRMLATSVGLTVINQLAKGSIVTSFFDLCSLLPAGSLAIPEEEGAAMDVGRRTLLVFIKSSGS